MSQKALGGTQPSLPNCPFHDVNVVSNIQGSKQLNHQLGDSLQKAGISSQAFSNHCRLSPAVNCIWALRGYETCSLTQRADLGAMVCNSLLTDSAGNQGCGAGQMAKPPRTCDRYIDRHKCQGLQSCPTHDLCSRYCSGIYSSQ